ncbi:hypothetical protein [Actinopolymorpha pittospori]|uniref:Uncharacterized protein n=1 Tax=Actinopolymorpha pittospori TaxID=648752 RepID=A0A927MV30_9ACTN|nr:hypothetical protein [Actinopolymorpha pittospori]MBE1605353.1 hypothetical protein [Actinopolymorpha pittospori]
MASTLIGSGAAVVPAGAFHPIEASPAERTPAWRAAGVGVAFRSPPLAAVDAAPRAGTSVAASEGAAKPVVSAASPRRPANPVRARTRGSRPRRRGKRGLRGWAGLGGAECGLT